MFKFSVLSKLRFFALHALVALSILALWGWIESANKYLILFSVISFFGALCFAFAGISKKILSRLDKID